MLGATNFLWFVLLAPVTTLVVCWLTLIVHEFGHALAYRMCGMRVWGMTLGMGRSVRFKAFGIAFRIGWIPTSGSCFADALEGDDAKTLWCELLITLAGSLAELAVALVILSVSLIFLPFALAFMVSASFLMATVLNVVSNMGSSDERSDGQIAREILVDLYHLYRK